MTNHSHKHNAADKSLRTYHLIRPSCRFLVMRHLLLFAIACFSVPLFADETPIKPSAPVTLFNGKDLGDLKVWLRDSRAADSKGVFTVKDGVIHISGDGFGYARTEKAYRDYSAVLEYKWGQKTDGGKYVRNSGLLVNANGPDGGAGKGAWMSCIEVQLAQGCEGDLIGIRGADEKGQTVPVRLFADVAIGPDKKPRWKEGGEKREFVGRQLWWSNHEPFFKELLDTRGKDDVASPLGEWTKVECVCEGSTITVIVNGKTVNKAYDVFPAAGHVLLQCEGHELYVRKFELLPVK